MPHDASENCPIILYPAYSTFHTWALTGTHEWPAISDQRGDIPNCVCVCVCVYKMGIWRIGNLFMMYTEEMYTGERVGVDIGQKHTH